ncbi:transcription factor Adf-1-like [Ischnura elegans]|uniref:transcription factor Adf-1-like n=1 Tax=Ischnura elegans TaxID=197161 RepID=UPI001ED87CFD|nr:transcription factor Adf-1-like [Ischnura elegans]
MATKFSAGDDECLIEEVRKYASLYDHQHIDFKDYSVKENTWTVIASKLGKNVGDCKKRWRNVRDNYLKYKRKHKLRTGSAASAKTSKWPLYRQLSFLDLVKQGRRTQSSITERDTGDNSESENSDQEEGIDNEQLGEKPSVITDRGMNNNKKRVNSDDSRAETPDSDNTQKSTKFRKTVNITAKLAENFEERARERLEIIKDIRKHKKEDDEVDHFMKSMALKMKKLSPQLIAKAQIGILSLITDLQFSQSNTHILDTPLRNTTVLSTPSTSQPCPYPPSASNDSMH